MVGGDGPAFVDAANQSGKCTSAPVSTSSTSPGFTSGLSS
jgi:hypothetical protein